MMIIMIIMYVWMLDNKGRRMFLLLYASATFSISFFSFFS